MSKKFKTTRNEFGRTPTEQAAWDKINSSLEGILTGEIDPINFDFNNKCINVGTGAEMTGMNAQLAIVIASLTGETRFVSATEARSRGWNIKGAKGWPFSRPITSKAEDSDDGEGETSTRVFFKTYYLFNLADIEHDLKPILQVEAKQDETDPCEDWFYKALNTISSITTLTRDNTSAYHSAVSDCINIPPHESFPSWSIALVTALHEFGHLIGIGTTSRDNYAKYRGFEELVAEMTALVTMQHLSLSYEAGLVSYIASWLDHAKTTHKEPISEAFKEACRRSDILIKHINQKHTIQMAA
ncbi:zincin-like metallopeptidase domain-containing protein [Marinomonas sp. TI.3.20]|uniref:zincin-like metallopeptidase domain-containing protein n=1 Tax=Marinomonas sp. TI.3.20 TaxID=3121296 RepID=UPI00311F222A